MSDDLTKHCMCGCIYLEAECPNCNKVTDADRIEELETLLMDVVADLRDGVSADKIDYRIGKVILRMDQ